MKFVRCVLTLSITLTLTACVSSKVLSIRNIGDSACGAGCAFLTHAVDRYDEEQDQRIMAGAVLGAAVRMGVLARLDGLLGNVTDDSAGYLRGIIERSEAHSVPSSSLILDDTQNTNRDLRRTLSIAGGAIDDIEAKLLTLNRKERRSEIPAPNALRLRELHLQELQFLNSLLERTEEVTERTFEVYSKAAAKISPERSRLRIRVRELKEGAIGRILKHTERAAAVKTMATRIEKDGEPDPLPCPGPGCPSALVSPVAEG